VLLRTEVLKLQAWALAKLYEAGDLTAEEAIELLASYADRLDLSRTTGAQYFNDEIGMPVCLVTEGCEAVDA